ncbi:integral membrane protein-like protein [Eremomyces bilateralis CBS 781.70]|uniref:Integral membrane protein-like protein n=1 Tax=Eremomyces bilateralis CBS 781.70 TaxID=1392243 RepID=A0A6G1GIB4_9PEZI|nr:integral membrane protein-like protein [Eremomyces bilateralis CBS 781.70]KAF1817629.1 integral membrane protein-like protein [Eremomyces bilateralis CBS 781.70]
MAKSDAEIRKRIITHMNKDHYDSIIRYVQHYAHCSPFHARNATLTDITTTHLTIQCGTHTYPIPLTPPLGSLSEARPRLVAMNRTATDHLGHSAVTVKQWVPPLGVYAATFLMCVLGFFVLSRDAHMAPGSWAYEYGLKYGGDAFTGWLRRYRGVGFGLMLAIHATEAMVMARGKMVRHAVPVGSGLWWKWVGGTFVDGVCSFHRFDALVARREKEMGKKGHLVGGVESGRS